MWNLGRTLPRAWPWHNRKDEATVVGRMMLSTAGWWARPGLGSSTKRTCFRCKYFVHGLSTFGINSILHHIQNIPSIITTIIILTILNMEEMVIRVFAQCMLTPVIPSPAGDPRSLPDNAFVPPALNNHQGLWTLRDYHDEEIGVGKLIQQIGSGRKFAHFTVCLLLVLPHKEFWKKTRSRFRDWSFSQWWALLCGSSITRYCSHNQAINFTLVGHSMRFSIAAMMIKGSSKNIKMVDFCVKHL